jgi:hypothetical protein
MTTLGELGPGDVFRKGDGTLWLRHGYHDRRYATAMPLGADGGGKLFHVDDPVEPLDLPALLKERDELLGAVHDLLIDSEAERRGREAERGEVVRLLEVYAAEAEGERSVLAVGSDAWRAVRQRLALARRLLEDVRARGPAAAPLPPARLAARVRELEGALRGLVRDCTADGDPVEPRRQVLDSARAALEGVKPCPE